MVMIGWQVKLLNKMNRARLTASRRIEICPDLLHWIAVFCILSPVSKIGIELIDFERDEDFSMH